MGEFNKIMKIREHMVFTGRVQGVGFHRGDRHRCAVDDEHHGGHDDESTVKPVAHINVRDLAPGNGYKEQPGVDQPQDGQYQ